MQEHQPAGYFDSGDHPGTAGGTAVGNDTIGGIVLGSGQDAEHYDFCELEPASLAGRVHADLDGDGELDPGETPLAGVRIDLFDEQGNLTATTTTNQLGQYAFESLAPGVYSVREHQPAGYFDGIDHVGSAGGTLQGQDAIVDIHLGPAVDAVEYNFSEIPPASLSGMVHADLDGDCEFDPGELPLAGVVVQLLDGQGNVVRATVTDAAGRYTFEHLAPGTYGIRELQPSGYFDGGEEPGTAGGTVSDNDLITGIQLHPGENATEYHFCEIPPAKLSGYVFQDGPALQVTAQDAAREGFIDGLANSRDGIRTPDDRPLAGVTLRLADGSGAVLLDVWGNPIETRTDANGYYEFNLLPPGLYTVIQVQPAGYLDGRDTAGSTGGIPLNPGTFVVLPNLGGGTDAIALVPLGAGQNSIENNFSELVFEVLPELQAGPLFVFPPAATLPPPVVISPPAPIQPAVPAPDTLLAVEPPRIPVLGSGGARGYTWHLSVIDAGMPRGERRTSDVVAQLASARFDAGAWRGVSLDRGVWVLGSAVRNKSARRATLGIKGGIPVTGDFNGDGETDVGVFAEGQWFLDINANGLWDEDDLWARLGAAGDLPVTGDWDGDGKTDIGIYGKAWPGDPGAVAAEPGLPHTQNKILATATPKNVPPAPPNATLGWRTLKRTSIGEVRADVIDHVFHYGVAGDRPVTGDWDGSGVDSIGVFNDGQWTLDTTGDGRPGPGDASAVYGHAGDLPVVGDFNGDGVDEIGVYRDGTWHLDTNGNRVLDEDDSVHELGSSDHRPVVGDFDGDGVDEIGTYREQPAAEDAL